MTSLSRHYAVLKKPVITEKATDDQLKRNAYHFRVPVDANKVEIRQAIQSLFDVTVKNVNTVRIRGKYRRRGWSRGASPEWKRAMVTLADDDTIEFL